MSLDTFAPVTFAAAATAEGPNAARSMRAITPTHTPPHHTPQQQEQQRDETSFPVSRHTHDDETTTQLTLIPPSLVRSAAVSAQHTQVLPRPRRPRRGPLLPRVGHPTAPELRSSRSRSTRFVFTFERFNAAIETRGAVLGSRPSAVPVRRGSIKRRRIDRPYPRSKSSRPKGRLGVVWHSNSWERAHSRVPRSALFPRSTTAGATACAPPRRRQQTHTQIHRTYMMIHTLTGVSDCFRERESVITSFPG
jgi:hypothetical protein